MSWDDLEPGQDDLINDGHARKKINKKIKKAVRNARPGLSEEEALYTDHNAGDPRSLTPKAERAPRHGKSTSPLKGGPIERVRSGFRSIKEAWNQAYQEAQFKQQERRRRKGK